MDQSSPIREGFSSLGRDSAVVLAEVAWRWAFGAAAIALSGAALLVYLNSLTVSSAELWGLRSRTPWLVVDAVVRILRGSGPRFLLTALLVTFGLSVTWIVVASLGRAATLARLCSDVRNPAVASELAVATSQSEFPVRPHEFRRLVVLHFIRAVFFYATMIAYIGAAIVADRAARSGTEPSLGVYLVIFFLLAIVISFARSRVVWLASVAVIYVVAQGHSVVCALQRAAGLYTRRPGQITRINTIIGLMHFVIFMVASFMSVSAFVLFGEVPAGVVIVAIALIALLYFASADFLHIARMAAYVSLIEGEDSTLAPHPSVPDPARPADATAPPLGSPAW
ncbi:MAG: hypothetical protein JO187_08390 [Acidobacteria bacterium]|nr:hypothetical protein [Acidobacteriota bacterium]